MPHRLRSQLSVLYLFAAGSLTQAAFVEAAVALLGEPAAAENDLRAIWMNACRESGGGSTLLTYLMLRAELEQRADIGRAPSDRCMAVSAGMESAAQQLLQGKATAAALLGLPPTEPAPVPQPCSPAPSSSSTPAMARLPPSSAAASPSASLCAASYCKSTGMPGMPHTADVFAGASAIDRRSFRDAMLRLGLRASEDEIDALFDHIDHAGTGAVDRHQLLTLLRQQQDAGIARGGGGRGARGGVSGCGRGAAIGSGVAISRPVAGRAAHGSSGARLGRVPSPLCAVATPPLPTSCVSPARTRPDGSDPELRKQVAHTPVHTFTPVSATAAAAGRQAAAARVAACRAATARTAAADDAATLAVRARNAAEVNERAELAAATAAYRVAATARARADGSSAASSPSRALSPRANGIWRQASPPPSTPPSSPLPCSLASISREGKANGPGKGSISGRLRSSPGRPLRTQAAGGDQVGGAPSATSAPSETSVPSPQPRTAGPSTPQRLTPARATARSTDSPCAPSTVTRAPSPHLCSPRHTTGARGSSPLRGEIATPRLGNGATFGKPESTPASRRDHARRREALSSRLAVMPTPGPGDYAVDNGAADKRGEDPPKPSPWAASRSDRMGVQPVDFARAAPGAYECTRETIASSASAARSPSRRSQRGSGWWSHSEQPRVGVLYSGGGGRDVTTPGPGEYHHEGDATTRQGKPASMAAATAVESRGLSHKAPSGIFRSATPQHLTHGPPTDTPPPDAYDLSSGSIGDSVSKASLACIDGSAGTFAASRSDRFQPSCISSHLNVGCTPVHVGPGSYSPEAGERYAKSRHQSTANVGAQSFPFSSTDGRSSSFASEAKLLATSAAVDGEVYLE